jgi:hypothetical protein
MVRRKLPDLRGMARFRRGPGCIPQILSNALPADWVDFAVGFRCARAAAKPH